jgi:hypothetical protein
MISVAGITVLGFTIAWTQVAAILVEIIVKVVPTIISIYQAQIENGAKPDDASGLAAELLRKSIAATIFNKIGLPIPIPHQMTRDEEELWFGRAQSGVTS